MGEAQLLCIGFIWLALSFILNKKVGLVIWNSKKYLEVVAVIELLKVFILLFGRKTVLGNKCDRCGYEDILAVWLFHYYLSEALAPLTEHLELAFCLHSLPLQVFILASSMFESCVSFALSCNREVLGFFFYIHLLNHTFLSSFNLGENL
jgi:hypothetical protein